jgi:hypothetical protein
MSTKSSCVGLVYSAAVFRVLRGGAFGSCLDYKGCDPMNGLIH